MASEQSRLSAFLGNSEVVHFLCMHAVMLSHAAGLWQSTKCHDSYFVCLLITVH